jgi:nitrogen fixation protein FixH
MKISTESVNKNVELEPAGRGGTCLSSQHLGGRGRWISEFEASLVYKVSSRTARPIQRNPVSKNQTKPNQKKKKKKKCFHTALTRGLS